MEGSGDCFVSGSLATVLRISRLVGLAPLWFKKQGDGWCITVAPKLNILSYFVLIISSLGSFYFSIGKIQTLNWESQKAVMRLLMLLMETFSVMLIAILLMYGAPKRMQFLKTCLYQVHMINSNFNICRWPTQWKKKQIGSFLIWIISSPLISITHYVLLIVSTSERHIGMYVEFLWYWFHYWITELGMVQVFLLVTHVKTSFNAINDCLRNIQQDDIIKSRSHHENIRRIITAYVSACNVMRDVNRSYGLLMMMFIVYLFLHLVIAPYHLLVDIPQQDFLANSSIRVLQLYWCIYQTINLVMIVEPCHLTHMQTDYTRELVSHLLMMRRPQATYDPLTVELEHFCSYLTLNDVSYKPLQLIKMTRGFVLTILGSITTYLVIITEIN